MSAIIKCSEGSTKGRHSWLSTGMITLCVALLGATAAYADTPVDWTKYNYSFTVRFAGYGGNTTLTDFPVLVRVSEDRISFPIYAKCKIANGGDLRFSDATGALLASEVESWNPGGESLVWVKVPSLNAGTVITGHFGCTSPDAVTPSDVWSNGFLGVWHLNADAGSLIQANSVAEGKSFVLPPDTVGVLAGTNGVAGLAAAFGQSDSGNGAYALSDSAKKYSGFDKLTVEYWTYYNDHSVGGLDYDARVLYKYNAWSSFEANGNGRMGFTFKLGGSDKYVNPTDSTANKAQPKVWNHTVSVFNGTYSGEGTDADTKYNRAVYLNGTSLSTANSDIHGTMVSNGEPLYLGNNGSGNEPYHGIIDEVRLSTMTRSADWVKATYDTIANSAFAVYEGPQLDWTVYGKKFPLTFTNIAESVTLKDFPVLVRISEYDSRTGKGIKNFRYADCRKPDGGDMRFFDESGTLLASEVETWNTSGESLVWVKIPTLSKDTKIFAYYGSKYVHAVTPSYVWSNGFLGVWHLNARGTSDQPDSVAGGNSFVLNSTYADGVQAGTNGIAGLAAAFHQNADGTGAYSITDSAGKYSGFDKFTVEYWTYYDDHGVGGLSSNARVLYKDKAWSSYEASGNGRMGLSLKLDSGTGDKYVNPTDIKANKVQPEVWNHTVSIFNGTYQGVGSDADTKYNRAVYLNGTALSTIDSDIHGTMVSSDKTLYLGNNKASGTEPYHGIIDEVRISNVTRSAAWVKATYDTIANNAAFVAYGAARQNNKGGLMVFIR